MAFKDAFAKARKAGKKEFSWGGKRYNTKLKSETSGGSSNSTKGGTASRKTNSSPSDAIANSVAKRNSKTASAERGKTRYQEAGGMAARSSMGFAPEPKGSPTEKKMAFGEAFSTARKGGRKTFTWNGKSYNTKLKK